MRRALALLTILAGWTMFASDAAGAKGCGSVYGEGRTPSDVTAENVPCHRARKVASKVSKVERPPWNGCVEDSLSVEVRLIKPCVKDGYRCKTIDRDDETGNIRVRCAKGNARIRFWL